MKQLSLIMGLALSLLVACSDDRHTKDLHMEIEQFKSQAAASANNDLSPYALLKPLQFNAENTRSPFATSTETHTNSQLPPLQSYELKDLRFKGTMTYDTVIHAYILTPDDKVYEAKIGDMLGNHYGKIKTIHIDRVQVEEYLSDNGGQGASHIITMQLKDGS